MLHLHLLRHAKTEQISPTGKDYDRYLMKKGLLQREDLVHFFREKKGIDEVWCSTSKRTRETLEPLLKTGLPEPKYFDALYLCSRQTLLQMLWKTEGSGSILIVGHNYGLTDLLNYFCENDTELRTGQYARISFDCNDWSETFRGTGTMAELYRSEV